MHFESASKSYKIYKSYKLYVGYNQLVNDVLAANSSSKSQ
jgi:hypothetical protein